MRQEGTCIVGETTEAFGAGNAEHVEYASLQDRQQGEEPQSQSDVTTEQVGETDKPEVQHDDDLGRTTEQGVHRDQRPLPPPGGNLRDRREVGVQGVVRADQKGHGKPDPHGRIAEEWFENRFGAIIADHVQRHLDEWIEQFLALHPLTANDDHGARRSPVDGEDEYDPVEYGLDPRAPGQRQPLGQPLVEVAHGIFVLGHRPPRQEGVERLEPSVFWCCVVGESRDDRQQVFRKPDRRNDGRHHGHDVDRGQFTA
jgi:hypothetical protein